MARFFFSLVAPEPSSWNAIAVTTLVMLVGFIAAPACLMAVGFTRRPGQTLLLRGPAHWALVPIAALLAMCLHPLLLWLNQGIGVLYPINPAAAVKLHEIETFFLGAPIWQALAVVCLAPAICEELAFRGFILTGLRQGSRDWTAIAISSAVFGLAHGILQQSLSATLVGVVLGYLAVQTGSLWPCVVYHALHNGLSLGLSRLETAAIPPSGVLRWVLVVREGGEVTYAWPFMLFAAAVAVGLLWWLRSSPSTRSSEATRTRIDSHNEPVVARSTLKLFAQFEAELEPTTTYHLVEPSVSE
jgi:sodium transport system permease protein